MHIQTKETIESYLYNTDWRVQENSNEDFSFSSLVLYSAGKVISDYMLNTVYPKHISQAHVQGAVHVHDLANGLVGYCAGWSLKQLLMQGLGNVPNKVECRPAKHLSTVVHHMINFIGCLQMEFAGAQAFSSVDTLLAPFIKIDGLSYAETKQCIQQLVFSLNIPSRWGCQTPFTNLTFDWTVPADLRDERAIVGGKKQEFTYGDCQHEMDLINQAFLEVMLEGDGIGRLFTWPIPTYNLTHDFNWDNANATLLFEVTAKYGLPYFQNYIGSNLDPRSIRAMCCRLNLDQTQLLQRPGGMWGPGDSTGSIGVVTINLNRLGYLATDEDDFYQRLSVCMQLSKEALEIKRTLIDENLAKGLMPYTKAYLGTFRNHFSTIGLCGMNECCLNLFGETIATQRGTDFTIRALHVMREQLIQFQQETGNLYNLEATPAEGASYRLARCDKKLYPDIITAGNTEPYLTNSTQLPVDYTDDLVAALEHQNKIQPLYTGGTIFHTFLGEQLESAQACKLLVRKIAYNTKLPYFSITPTFSICTTHGYLKGEVTCCPLCQQKTEVYSRIVGYIRPVSHWNKGKKEEFLQRREFEQTPEMSLNRPAHQYTQEQL